MDNPIGGENQNSLTIPFAAPPVISINEVDADTPSTDTAEFVELYDGGIGNSSLDGLVIVFFNGADNKAYAAFDLDGLTTNAEGFFVLGNSAVPNVNVVFSNNILQNGADAVGLYQANAADFPNGTLATTTNLLDALVYDTDDADASGLLTDLGQTTQFNENANNKMAAESNSRSPDGTGTFVAQAPTPGAANVSSSEGISRNHAPVLGGTPIIPAIGEDVANAANLGTTVADLIAGLVTDADFDPKGIAITSVDNTNGTWQFSTNGGETWQAIGNATSNSNAVVLGATSLYSGDLGIAPSSQGWLAFANVVGATETVEATGTTLNTMANQAIYAGYSNFNGPVLANPDFPNVNRLDNTLGYRISFNLQLLEESRTNNNRAGFSIIAVSQDKTKAIELGFQKLSDTTGKIFAQGCCPLFEAVESVSFNTTVATQYTLAVKDNAYTLLADGVQILTGSMRDYSAFVGTFDPYETPNFIFLGDDTTSARGSFILSQVAVETETRLRFMPNADYNGTASITMRAWDTTDGSFNGETGVDASQNGGQKAFSTAEQGITLTITPVNDGPTGNVILTGTTQVGSTLLADTSTLADAEGLGAFSYSWQQSVNGIDDWKTIAGADNNTLPLAQTQVGYYVRAVVNYNDGKGTAETVLGAPTPGPIQSASWPNFLGNGSADILWHQAQAGQTVVWSMDGTELESGQFLESVDPGWELKAIGDFNQDDHPDLVWQHRMGGTALWLMEGISISEGISLESVDPGWQIEAAADFNQDDAVDILWRHQTSGQNVVWLMEGTERTGVMWLETVASPDWQVGTVGDFTQDGNLEVLWRHRTAGTNVVWFLEGSDIVDFTMLQPVEAGWDIVGAADLTRDGNLDILWRHRTAGANVVWAMDGLELQNGIVLPEAGPEWVAVI